MSIAVFEDDFYCAKLFGEPVLYTNWLIQRETVPDGWFCYDLKGSAASPQTPFALVSIADVRHTGAILSPKPLLRSNRLSRRVRREFEIIGEIMSLEQFCEEYNIPVPSERKEPAGGHALVREEYK